MNILSLIGRDSGFFESDINAYNEHLIELIKGSRFLVIGGAGTIGQAVTREIFKREPAALHVVDLSENNMVELVRDIRSTLGYITGDFKTFAIDCGSREFEALVDTEGPYDYIFNLSALKHVRGEKDPFTLMRMVDVNIFNTVKTLRVAKSKETKKYFCVSTDKATNPVNMMGASKRIMEMFLMKESLEQPISMARFANVAFSDGSLLHGFNQRFAKKQPITAPYDVKRYFVTPQESGELCLMSGLLGENRDIFFPKMSDKLHLITFSEIAKRYLNDLGYEAFECASEDEARNHSQELISDKKWPCYFFKSDTTGEKDFEEFFTNKEVLNLDKFSDIGVIKNSAEFNADQLHEFTLGIENLRRQASWSKSDLLKLFFDLIPDFMHKETGKYLDQRM
ncbi:UDP-N-acetylglucosamine 4,6-dehydratase [Chromobacterium piscinae]|uniref:UDP-N-acetylglucosamine 4,6-dehydratase n=1 Tax=Chromobacterium piscinae TaxID=686831 RepID=UPI00140A51A2|nr:UDP-N-acetylglucosamine 4,6-dehydratase [Chromobacterium piscinae]MBX9295169.1 UDP-N-acetylglucosamine 4,6-dehydratase [Chromobacterium vaccinii]MBX9358908.1 UDP-N-acetylglucosamine 4,6-dehydratase [Chromobacterium vaccinii]MCD4506186.1 UDP-N-acetylglucosamine 4,6-dehydratase [Chromobacterium piscinae]MCD5326836.1 UDP-N-acetylglucosamine 4,6-dehydratase [Chromobacterium piscinae]NHQ82500.1 UDP-N-acetylglucosamine 4,6-dehydratase [Chromobacterium vaccinii]